MLFIGPNDSCVAFHVTFSKTLRGGQAKEFGASEMPGEASCPVKAMMDYMRASKALFQWDWDQGSFYVFPFIGRTGLRLDTAVTAAAMSQRFQRHLERASPPGESGAESLHGLRAGGALRMAVAGAELHEVMLQGFWRSPATALHYIGILDQVVGPEFKEAVRSKGWLTSL